jgi:pyruvate,water dikinase
VEDVFFLRLPEIVEVASGDVKFAPKQVSAMRRQDHERWGHLIPPRYLGVAPPAAMVSLMSRFFGGIASTSTEASVINGMAASAGVARGTARVILDLSDAERLNTGDILVCPSTAPPWTPLFAVAGAVVADSGGVLSHTAICAREYAIPAVVSTIVATRQIPDGATVTVDGTKGIVRIEALE